MLLITAQGVLIPGGKGTHIKVDWRTKAQVEADTTFGVVGKVFWVIKVIRQGQDRGSR